MPCVRVCCLWSWCRDDVCVGGGVGSVEVAGVVSGVGIGVDGAVGVVGVVGLSVLLVGLVVLGWLVGFVGWFVWLVSLVGLVGWFV